VQGFARGQLARDDGAAGVHEHQAVASSFCMMKPSPPNSAVITFFWKCRPMLTPRAAHRKLSFWQIMRPPKSTAASG
jgi:hypothetical protein